MCNSLFVFSVNLTGPVIVTLMTMVIAVRGTLEDGLRPDTDLRGNLLRPARELW